ncbi:MAG: biotin transporter BioY [Alphaproteobacteria bacterium]|nr:biotin transporter BioY [Alphaproteobacteria bacterium]
MNRAIFSETFLPSIVERSFLLFRWFPAVIFGTFFLMLSSYVSVPLSPVPLTMQTFSVFLLCSVYGFRLGVLTVMAWLLEGAAGFPVFAGGGGGLSHLFGPTGGYLFSFLFFGGLIGALSDRGHVLGSVTGSFCFLFLCEGGCLVFGGLWLAVLTGWKFAILHGVLPFLSGALLKVFLGASIFGLLGRVFSSSPVLPLPPRN